MASGIRRVRGRNGLRARDAAHGHMAVVAVIFVWTVFIVVVHVHVVLLVVLVVLVGAARLRLLLRQRMEACEAYMDAQGNPRAFAEQLQRTYPRYTVSNTPFATRCPNLVVVRFVAPPPASTV